MNIPQEAVEAAVLAMDGASLCGCSDCQRVTALNILAAAEPHLRRKWAEELVERIGASNLGAPLRLDPDGTAHIASGPEMRAKLCEFIMEGAGE